MIPANWCQLRGIRRRYPKVLCVRVGGVLTGEHGVGIEKRDLMGVQFTEIDLDQQMRVKCAFDPDHLLNPGKVFPGCGAAPNSARWSCITTSCHSPTFRGSKARCAASRLCSVERVPTLDCAPAHERCATRVPLPSSADGSLPLPARRL